MLRVQNDGRSILFVSNLTTELLRGVQVKGARNYSVGYVPIYASCISLDRKYTVSGLDADFKVRQISGANTLAFERPVMLLAEV